VRGSAVALDRSTLLMGVVNVTPDSFSDGGKHATTDAAVAHGLRLMREGATILDVGGESTRPGAEPVPAAEEIRRAVPVVRQLAEAGALVSIDTRKAEVAAAAIDAGAAIVNDITAGADPAMLPLCARERVGVVLMHMQGDPASMQRAPSYQDVVAEVREHLRARAHAAEAAGIARESIVLDPGLGFGKTQAHNLALIRGLPEIAMLGYPILAGASRKSFLGALTAHGGVTPAPTDRIEASLATHVLLAERGASILRVHDVTQHRRALAVADWILQER
jgi:dihydropteroate synthase